MTSTTADESVEPGQWVRWARWLVPAFVVALLAIALRTLEGELAHLRYHDVIAAVRQVPRGDIVLALVLTLASYLVLPGYDYLSLRYAGKPLPLRRIAFGSIITYGISQTLGLPAFTGATLRVRLWSAWGLSTDEIARAVAFASTTFSLGVLFLTGVAGIVEPSSSLASLHLPVAIARGVAVLCLAVPAAWMAWNVVARGKALNILGATIAVPGPKMVGAQLAVATIDWIVAGSVLFVLLPEGHGVRFAAFLAAFVLAHVAGLLSRGIL